MRSGPRWKWWRCVCVAAAVCALLAVLAGSSSALNAPCTTNPDGTRTCRGTDTFNYAGPGDAGCPPANSVDTLTIDEEVAQDASNVTGTWGNDPTAVCGGIIDTSGNPYKPGDALRGGAYKLDANGNRVVGPKGGYVWEWTVKVPGKDAGGDHPALTVAVTYDRPAASSGSGSGGGGGTPACAWSVRFAKAPRRARRIPVSYAVDVSNLAPFPCPATTLTVELSRGVATEFERAGTVPGSTFANPLHLTVPGLPAHGRVRLSFLAFPTVADLGAMGNFIEIQASLPADAFGPGRPAVAVTKLNPKSIPLTGGRADNHGDVRVAAFCPAGEQQPDRCAFKLDIPESPLPQERLLDLPLGSAQGTVAAGHDGEIALRLREAGRKILERRHRINETVIGTRTEDGVSTLVEGHVVVKR